MYGVGVYYPYMIQKRPLEDTCTERLECRVTKTEKKRIKKKAKLFKQNLTEHLVKASDAYKIHN